jgi:hypothetical protein
MRNMLLVSIVILCLTPMVGAQLPDGAIALHVDDVQLSTLQNCDAIDTDYPAAYPGQILYFHVVVCGHMYDSPANNGFSGLEYDIQVSPGGLVLAYDSYADIWIGSPGTGITEAWSICQNQLHPYITGVLMVFVAYTPVYVDIVPHPMVGAANLQDCEFALWQVLPSPPGNGRAGSAVAGDVGGFNPCPCYLSPVEDMTWGTIKAMYR